MHAKKCLCTCRHGHRPYLQPIVPAGKIDDSVREPTSDRNDELAVCSFVPYICVLVIAIAIDSNGNSINK